MGEYRSYALTGGGIVRVDDRGWAPHHSAAVVRTRGGTMQVSITLRASDGEQREYAFTWTRRPADLDYEARSTRWTYTTPNGGEWKADFGYSGRWWSLYGPDGVPFGRLLQSSIRASLIEASEYIAKGWADNADDQAAIDAARGKCQCSSFPMARGAADCPNHVPGSVPV